MIVSRPREVFPKMRGRPRVYEWRQETLPVEAIADRLNALEKECGGRVEVVHSLPSGSYYSLLLRVPVRRA